MPTFNLSHIHVLKDQETHVEVEHQQANLLPENDGGEIGNVHYVEEDSEQSNDEVSLCIYCPMPLFTYSQLHCSSYSL